MPVDFILKKIDTETTYHRKVNLSIARKNEAASPVSETIGVMIVAVILYFGGSLVLSDDPSLTAGEFIAFLRSLQPNNSTRQRIFQMVLPRYKKELFLLSESLISLTLEPLVKNKPNPIILQEFKSEIEFRNVALRTIGNLF